MPSKNWDQHPGYLVTQAPTASLQLCVNSKSPSRAVHDFPWLSAPGESNPRKYSENFASSKSSLGVPSCVVPCVRKGGVREGALVNELHAKVVVIEFN